MRAGWVLGVLLVTGCGDDPAPRPTVASFEQCHVGWYFAECRDDDTVDAEPVLGCGVDGDCRWFTTGVAPAEIEQLSPCPADDICCIGNWPFEHELDLAPDGAYKLFYALDRLPWDRRRAMDLSVTVDATMTAPTPPSLVCTGSLAGEDGPCAAVEGVARRAHDTVAVMLYGPGDFFGSFPVIEVDQADDGALSARVCIHDYTDVTLDTCPEPSQSTAVCATAGAVTVAAWPVTAATAFHVSATFADGSTLVADGATVAAP